MIGTALKHFIYEICIDQLFNSIFNNFPSTHNSPLTHVSVNDDFLFITVRRNTKHIKETIYYDPIVVEADFDHFVIRGDIFVNVNRNNTVHEGTYHDDIPIFYDDILEYEMR